MEKELEVVKTTKTVNKNKKTKKQKRKMSQRAKTILYYIFTFGIGYLIAKAKAKKLAQQVNTEIKVNKTIDFDLNQLITKLGDVKNIESTSSTLSCLIINLHDKSLIKLDDFNDFNVKGVFLTGNKLNLVFGDNSKHIEALIKEKL